MKTLALILTLFISTAAAAEKTVIAHRGASGYLPEHSIAAKAMAHAMGADYIEQDLVMSKDDQLLVLHDHYLDRVTNVAEVFPGRQRADGRFYAIDFTLTEIRRLMMTEGFELKGGKQVAIFKHRFPIWKSRFQVHTFAEEIELIQGLNQSRDKDVGIYPEIKSPWFHRAEGKDISRAVLTVLKHYGYDHRSAKVFLQCFDPQELKKIKTEMMPALNMEVKLVQLIAMSNWGEVKALADASNTSVTAAKTYVTENIDWMLKPGGMKRIAQYADGVGPWLPMLVKNPQTKPEPNGLLKAAHAEGLLVHPYTLRSDKELLPKSVPSFEALAKFYLYTVGVDGVFTDFPDRVKELIEVNKVLVH